MDFTNQIKIDNLSTRLSHLEVARNTLPPPIQHQPTLFVTDKLTKTQVEINEYEIRILKKNNAKLENEIKKLYVIINELTSKLN